MGSGRKRRTGFLTTRLICRQGWFDIPLILGRLRPSKRLSSTHVLSQCATLRGGSLQPFNFSKSMRLKPDKLREDDDKTLHDIFKNNYSIF